MAEENIEEITIKKESIVNLLRVTSGLLGGVDSIKEINASNFGAVIFTLGMASNTIKQEFSRIIESEEQFKIIMEKRMDEFKEKKKDYFG